MLFGVHAQVSSAKTTSLVGKPLEKVTESVGKLSESPGEFQNREILSKIEPERALEMMRKHRKSLPNGRRQDPQGGAAKGGALLSSFGKDTYVFG